MKQKQKLVGEGIEELEQQILGLSSKNWNIKLPLPASRDLAAAFAVSHSAVYRLLQKQVSEEVLVAHEINGRFYIKGGEAFATRNLPVACLFRNMESWFFVSKNQIRGISKVCETLGRGMLLFRHDHLVSQPSVESAPIFGEIKDQIKSLEIFFQNHYENCSGIIFEDLWRDEALEKFESRLSRAVLIGRRSKIPSLKTISLESDTAAYQALAHLHGRGYNKVLVAIPYQGSQEIQQQIDSLQKVSQTLGLPIDLKCFYPTSTLKEREQLIQGIKKMPGRIAIFCPEDNNSSQIIKEIHKQGISCPEKIGLLSGMGEQGVQGLQISSICYDYVELGGLAGRRLFERNSKHHETISPSFYQGITT